MTSLLEARRSFVWPFPQSGLEQFAYAGNTYSGVAYGGVGGVQQFETAPYGYKELAWGPYKNNPIVWAAEQKRIEIFSQARFVWRGMNKGRPGNVFGSPELGILETPWPNGSTSDLLGGMLQSADIGGTAFIYRDRTLIGSDEDRLRVLRPDFTTIVMGDRYGAPVKSSMQLDAEIIGLIYNPIDGYSEPEMIPAEDVAVWAPTPDPLARFRGMPWIMPIIREAQADQATVLHKLAFFENGATPQIVMSFGPEISEAQFKAFVKKMDARHAGYMNAYRTLYVGGGATPTVVGKDIHQLDFAATQGKGETRIAAASGIHPVLVPVSEGMQGSSLNAGNYDSARRSTADTTMRHLWMGACRALSQIVNRATKADGSFAGPAELWIDEEWIPFLREDSQKVAENEKTKAETINAYIVAGFTPESAIKAVAARDVTLLVHTGLFSVQLQEIGVPPPGSPDGVTPPSTIPAQTTATPPPAKELAAAGANGAGGKKP